MERLKRMQLPIKGGCLCGEVSYQCSTAPIWSVNCHCRACQMLSGAPYVSAFSVPAEAFTVNSGDTIKFFRESDNGNKVSTTYCAKCGTRLFAQSEGNQALVNIFAPTLEDAANFVPISNVYLSAAACWIEPDEKRFNFEKMPEF
ncbi:GFA family protein [Parasphingorhabdus sp.]|uniref:GFA family protein n=2 Tax=Parasphingorhabdus sp. TaxID=2709688 RepID=UPI0032630D81